MPIVIPKTHLADMVTPLTRPQILKLTLMLDPTAKRTETVGKAIDRFHKALSDRIGAPADSSSREILSSPYEIAEGKLHAALDEVDAPVAEKPKRTRARRSSSDVASILGRQLEPLPRYSSYYGTRLYTTRDENPRRVGTFGHYSLKIIADAGKVGLPFEDYIANGGRLSDLRWNVKYSYVLARGKDAK